MTSLLSISYRCNTNSFSIKKFLYNVSLNFLNFDYSFHRLVVTAALKPSLLFFVVKMADTNYIFNPIHTYLVPSYIIVIFHFNHAKPFRQADLCLIPFQTSTLFQYSIIWILFATSNELLFFYRHHKADFTVGQFLLSSPSSSVMFF